MITGYNMLPRLALVTSYSGDATIAPANGASLTATGPSSSTCTKNPSVKLTDVITVTSPGGGWCGGSSTTTLAAAGTYVLTATGVQGTLLSQFQCYNISSGSAGVPVNVAAGGSITLQANEVWTCAAGEMRCFLYLLFVYLCTKLTSKLRACLLLTTPAYEQCDVTVRMVNWTAVPFSLDACFVCAQLKTSPPLCLHSLHLTQDLATAAVVCVLQCTRWCFRSYP
jgi:hypothetical protein